jgi:hypothetical protein
VLGTEFKQLGPHLLSLVFHRLSGLKDTDQSRKHLSVCVSSAGMFAWCMGWVNTFLLSQENICSCCKCAAAIRRDMSDPGHDKT